MEPPLAIPNSDPEFQEPVFRQAEKEWQAFIQVFTDHIVDADPQIPHLPPKDVIHRIYRDVSSKIGPHPEISASSFDRLPPKIRFSNDKTPYKTGFSASFSRSGRKGIFAHCTLPSSISSPLD
jgi:uncharacterized protein (DUF2461 family)